MSDLSDFDRYCDEHEDAMLAWQESVMDQLILDRPTNHSSVMAVLPVLTKYANPDGTRIYPTQATIAREAGLHVDTVRDVMEYLRDADLEPSAFAARETPE